MMATAAVIGLTTGKRLLSTSFYPSDVTDKLFQPSDIGSMQFLVKPSKSSVTAQKSSHLGGSSPSSRRAQAIKAVKEIEHVTITSTTDLGTLSPSGVAPESSLEALLLLQKSMLEKQYELQFDRACEVSRTEERSKKDWVIRSGITARKRRASVRKKPLSIVPLRHTISPEVQPHARSWGYVRGNVSENLLSHAEVVHLSKKIKAGLLLEEHRSKLRAKLGTEPSDKQLAQSLRICRSLLQSRLIECSLAREKLAMSNVRLVMSIAQKYENSGAEMSDLIQGGLVGLLRGIEKFDSSKGFRISTYVYWWIRQGISKASVRTSRTLRLPSHLHERLNSIRNAKVRLEDQGISPSIDKLSESLKMSPKKIRNATEAVSKVISLDRQAFPSLSGLPGETLHSYVPDRNSANIPWHGFEEWAMKDEVNKLLHSTLNKRERDIIQLYHGLGSKCHTWEDISRQFGLSRERVRQVGLVAMEKLKHAARKKKLDAMLVNQ